ncbi:glycoside hydrolase family protein, partial [Rhodoplanes roseus]
MRISDRAFDDIVGDEVTDRATYERQYRRPTWPGEESGATVGIGYDLGQTARSTIEADWRGRVPDDMLAAMVAVAGRTGQDGKDATAAIRHLVDVPWETAIAVHRDCVVPRWEATVRNALPNCDALHPHCFGALVSLTFNRGASFGRDGDRYTEMRAIKAAMAQRDFAAVPALIRAMKRIWKGKGLDGLLTRRDREAKLFEDGLAAQAAPAPKTPPIGGVS